MRTRHVAAALCGIVGVLYLVLLFLVADAVVIVLFAMVGAGVFGPGQGVFDYGALSALHMKWWAAVITGSEAVLLGLLSYLALTPRSDRHDVTR